ncbi:MAG TPA: acyl-CoA thioesterase/BAAT N-terminal domain-containing protein [Chitinivibrionales bacterium]|nr:acyl-CoA thioesterase/BAAT N-terminal domain-containing protein [Chitinivibrionales bacterium]
MKLEANPMTALCDERIKIKATGLPPTAKVKMSAAMNFPWAKNIRYESFAFFTADAGGMSPSASPRFLTLATS